MAAEDGVVVFDASFLVLLLQSDAPPVSPPGGAEPIPDVSARLEHLIVRLQKGRTKIVIPTPALAEVLVRFPEQCSEILNILQSNYRFEIAAFDTRAAIENAMQTSSAISEGRKKGGSSRSWQRVKFDRQIVAIAKVRSAHTIYSNDGDIRRFARALSMRFIAVWDLDPPPPVQPGLPFATGRADEPTTASSESADPVEPRMPNDGSEE